MRTTFIFLMLTLLFCYVCFPCLSVASVTAGIYQDFDEDDYPSLFRTFDFNVNIEITDATQYHTIRVQLTSSNFKGTAANAGSSLETDLYFDVLDNFGWTVSGDALTLTYVYGSQNTSIPAKVKVRCRDWGAHGAINLTVSNTSIKHSIPKDVNNNNIADGWEKDHGIYEVSAAVAQAKAIADDEKGPYGTDEEGNRVLINNNHGDGWSVYDEYRGLYTTIDNNGNPAGYIRLNPKIKNMMYTSDASMKKYGLGSKPETPMHTLVSYFHR